MSRLLAFAAATRRLLRIIRARDHVASRLNTAIQRKARETS